jgi:hypothetical protein
MVDGRTQARLMLAGALGSEKRRINDNQDGSLFALMTTRPDF